MNEKGILVSGVKPTGDLHIGNYFGALRQFVSLQNEYQSRFFVADLHALTTLHDPKKVRTFSLQIVAGLLAIGVDKDKALIFLQSQTPEVTELAWIFESLTTMPYLSRAHAYKDAVTKNKDINVATFNYPLLMASDILIHDATVVPVGLDQKQHLEIAQDTAEKFNRTFGDTFLRPEPLIIEDVKTIPGIDGQKMSKSYNNTIGLFAEDADIEKAVMSIPTDSKGVNEPKNPDEDKIFGLHSLFSNDSLLDELRHRYEEGNIGYKESKEILIDSIKRVIEPIRTKYKNLLDNENLLLDTIRENGERARKITQEKIKEVRNKTGLAI